MVDNEYLQMKSTLAREFRTIDLDEEFNEISCYKVRYYLEKIEQEDKENGVENPEPITIRINSYGGAVHELNSILNVMERLEKKGYQINTHCEGKAMSCGALLLCTGSERKVYKYATILIHKLSSALWGNYDQMNIGHEEHVRLQNLLEKIIVDNTNIPMELLKEKTFALDWYISPEECLKYGIATEII